MGLSSCQRRAFFAPSAATSAYKPASSALQPAMTDCSGPGALPGPLLPMLLLGVRCVCVCGCCSSTLLPSVQGLIRVLLLPYIDSMFVGMSLYLSRWCDGESWGLRICIKRIGRC